MKALGHVAVALMLLLPVYAVAAEQKVQATLYKNPQCGCCEGHAEYLRQNGFDVETVATHDLPLIKRRYGIAPKFEACHTILIDKYVVEGHVSAATIRKLLAERPDIKGVSLPGMPEGSPGMSGRKREPWEIYEIGSDPANPKVFSVE